MFIKKVIMTEAFRDAYNSGETVKDLANMFNLKYANLYYRLYRSKDVQEIDEFLNQ